MIETVLAVAALLFGGASVADTDEGRALPPGAEAKALAEEPVDCAEYSQAWVETAEGPLRVGASSDDEAFRFIWGDHQSVFWWVFVLRFSKTESSLSTREVSNCAIKAAPPRTIILDAKTSGRLRGIVREAGFWEGRQRVPDPADYNSFRALWRHVSIEGSRAAGNVCYAGFAALDLEAWKPLADEVWAIANDKRK